jgi:hypothetical protein
MVKRLVLSPAVVRYECLMSVMNLFKAPLLPEHL